MNLKKRLLAEAAQKEGLTFEDSQILCALGMNEYCDLKKEAFCPTGPGGGIDPTCPSKPGSDSKKSKPRRIPGPIGRAEDMSKPRPKKGRDGRFDLKRKKLPKWAQDG